MKKRFYLLVILALLFQPVLFSGSHAAAAPEVAAPQAPEPTVYYVIAGTSGDCLSWSSACDLQSALALASAGKEIWVVQGVHTPTAGTDRAATFNLKTGVGIYGGFVGGEAKRTQRDFAVNVTTLSGNIGDPLIDTDNSYHVVSANGVDGTAILDGFTISGGFAFGAAPHERGAGLYNSGASNPTLTNLIISGNQADNYGGGLYNGTGSPSLTAVTLSDNVSTLSGGAIYNGGGNPTLTDVTISTNQAASEGGGLYTTGGSPTLNNVTFSMNTAAGANGGGGIYSTGSTLTLRESTISGNSTAIGSCGGLNSNLSTITLNNVVFSGNTAYSNGGGMCIKGGSHTLDNVTFFGNTAVHGNGGGLYNSESNPSLANVTFTENEANGNSGGGMYNTVGNPTLTNVTFTGNSTALNGGGMYNYSSSGTLDRVTFSGNTAAADGGGMWNLDSTLVLTDLTFSANNAGSDGGGMGNTGGSPTLNKITFVGNTATVNGGGLWNAQSAPQLTNVTFSGNTANVYGGGMYSHTSTATLTNVTVTGNAAPTGSAMYVYQGNMTVLTNTIVWGNLPSANHMYIAYTSIPISYSDIEGVCPTLATCTAVISADPLLGVLANNGGYTQTQALVYGSPAIDTGSPVTCPAIDQRDMERPLDGNMDGEAICDMGAYEYAPAGNVETVTTITSDEEDPSEVGELFTVAFSVTATLGTPVGTVNVTVSDSPAACSATLSGGVGSCTLVLDEVGDYTITAVYAGTTYFLTSRDTEEHTVIPENLNVFLPLITK